MPSACSIPGTGHRVPTSTGVSGCSPLPINDTKPSFVAASAVVYWCGRREPKAGRWKVLWGAEGAPREPEPWLLRQGPISSLTKAAMQYWRATGNPKLQYLRAARALLTALHPSASPLPPDPPFHPKHGETKYLADPLLGKGPEGKRCGARRQLKARCPSQRWPCPCWRTKRSYESLLPAGPAPLRHTHTLTGNVFVAAKDVHREKRQENLSTRTCSTELKRYM